MSWNRLAGAMIGLVGVAAMMGIDSSRREPCSLPNSPLSRAAVSYAFASVFGRRFAALPPIITAAGQTTASTLILLPLVLIIDLPWRLDCRAPQRCFRYLGLAMPLHLARLYPVFHYPEAGGRHQHRSRHIPGAGQRHPARHRFPGRALGTHHIAGMATIALGLALIDGRLLLLVQTCRA